MSIRTQRLGVLQVEVPGHSLDTDAAEVLDDVAQVLAYVVTGACRSVQGILPGAGATPDSARARSRRWRARRRG